jgi:hypothetical protein
VEAGDLLLLARLTVGQTATDTSNNESLDVWAARGSYTRFPDDHALARLTVDRLVYLTADETPQKFARDRRGYVLGNAFQGRASLRVLARGADRLDTLKP